MGLIIFFILRGSKHMYSYKQNIQKMHIRDFELRTVELLIVGGCGKITHFWGSGKKNSIFQRFFHKLHMILYIFRLFSKVIMQFNIF